MPGLKFGSSYYDKDYRMAASLIRARRPYLVKNAITGLGLFGVVVGIYAYTIHAIGQDNFEDVPIPDAPPQPAKTPNVGTTTTAGAATGVKK